MTALAHFYCQPNSHPFQERHVPLNEPTKIGRSVARCRPSLNNAVFDCKVLSRNHALLWFENGKFYLQDTKSSNGTFINNQRLSKASEESAAVEVNSYDIVQFGVDVVDSMRKVTHGCIVSQLRLYLPNGEECQQRNCAWNNKLVEKIPNMNPSTRSQDLYQLHHYLQEALHREQMLEQKLALLQRLLLNSQEASDKGWQALIDEDKLLSRLEFLENQLQVYNKTQTEDSLKSQLQQVQEEKHNYENTSKETLRKALQEKLDVVRKVSNMERCLSNSEDECTHLRDVQQQTQSELVSLAASHQAKIEEISEIVAKLQEVERKHTESANEIELQKNEIEKKFEALKEEEEKLRKNVALLEEDNKRLKELSESQQSSSNNEQLMIDASVQVEEGEQLDTLPGTTSDDVTDTLNLLSVDEVLSELDNIMDSSFEGEEDATGRDEEPQSNSGSEEHTDHAADVELKETERPKSEEEGNLDAETEGDSLQQQEEISRLKLYSELLVVLNDAGLQQLLDSQQIDGSSDKEEAISFEFIKTRIIEMQDKLQESAEALNNLKLENSQLQNQLLDPQRDPGNLKPIDTDQHLAVGDAGEAAPQDKALEEAKHLLDEELAENRNLVKEQENKILILQDQLQTAQNEANTLPHLQSELATSQSLLLAKEDECRRLGEELKKSVLNIKSLQENIFSIKSELCKQQEATLSHQLQYNELKETCDEQNLLIESLRNREEESNKTIKSIVEKLTQKEKTTLNLEEELSECTRQKEECQSKFNILNQSFVEIQRENDLLSERMKKIEAQGLKDKASLKEKESLNHSLKESLNEEQKKWENELSQKDEQLADAIARCQQLIQDREAAARREAAGAPIQKWILLGLLGTTFAIVYLCFFSPQLAYQ